MRDRQIVKYYTDRATIMRGVDGVTDYGETRMKSREVMYKDVPCRISQKELSTNNQREPANEINYVTKLFVSSYTDIKQGDEIEITRGSSVKRFKAGEPFPYRTHQEVLLTRLDKA